MREGPWSIVHSLIGDHVLGSNLGRAESGGTFVIYYRHTTSSFILSVSSNKNLSFGYNNGQSFVFTDAKNDQANDQPALTPIMCVGSEVDKANAIILSCSSTEGATSIAAEVRAMKFNLPCSAACSHKIIECFDSEGTYFTYRECQGSPTAEPSAATPFKPRFSLDMDSSIAAGLTGLGHELAVCDFHWYKAQDAFLVSVGVSHPDIAVLSFAFHIALRSPSQEVMDKMIPELTNQITQWSNEGILTSIGAGQCTKDGDLKLPIIMNHMSTALGRSGTQWQRSIGDVAGRAIGQDEYETTNNRMEGGFSATDTLVLENYSNGSIVTLVEMMIGTTSVGSESQRNQYLTELSAAYDEASPHTGVFAKSKPRRERQMRGAWAAQLSTTDMSDGSAPVIHLDGITFVQQGLRNVVGYAHDDPSLSFGGFIKTRPQYKAEMSSLVALLDPPGIETREGYFSVISTYGPGGNGYYCTSVNGPWSV